MYSGIDFNWLVEYGFKVKFCKLTVEDGVFVFKTSLSKIAVI